MEEQYLAVRDALVANLRLQDRLAEILGAAEQSINSNASVQNRLQASVQRVSVAEWFRGLKAVDFPTTGKPTPRLIGPSRFWMMGGKVPEPNADTQALLSAFSYLPPTFSIRRWTAEDDEQLRAAVLRHVQESMHEEYMTAAIQAGSLPCSEDLTDRIEQIGALELRSPGVEDAVEAFTLEGKWRMLAADLGSARTAADCMTRWTSHLRPSLKASTDGKEAPWSEDEEGFLMQLAIDNSRSDWAAIAEELGTGRSAAACLGRYQQLRDVVERKPWTEAEIAQLRLSYAKHAGIGAFWKRISLDLPGRSSTQVMHFWRNHVVTAKRKGKWLKEEDDALIAAVKVLGRKWSQVAQAVPSRTQVQCRERYVNALDPDIKRGGWTKEEDTLLLKTAAQCKNENGSFRWADIAASLPGRTDEVVLRRYGRLRTLGDGQGREFNYTAKRKKRQSTTKTTKAGSKAKRKSKKPKKKRNDEASNSE